MAGEQDVWEVRNCWPWALAILSGQPSFMVYVTKLPKALVNSYYGLLSGGLNKTLL